MAWTSSITSAFNRRPEVDALLACARTRMEPATAEWLRAVIQKKIDWNYVTQKALVFGTAPLLYWNLRRMGIEAIPGGNLHQLKEVYNAVAHRNLFLTSELLRILNSFRNAEIQAIPLKGPILAEVAYRNLSLRHFGDLDILMARKDILRARDVLVHLGYKPMPQLSAAEEQVRLQTHHEYTFCRPRDGVIVETQWGITQECFSFPVVFEELWRRREQVSTSGATMESLRLEDMLLILCVHGAKHRWNRLKWICDIAELVEAHRERMVWDVLMARARAFGGERMLLLGLFLANDLLGAVLPNEVLKKLQDESQIKDLGSQVYKLLFGEPSSPLKLREEPPFFYYKVRERFRDKLPIVKRYFREYFFRAIAPNGRDRALLKLPAVLSPGYYFIRPLRLMRDFLMGSK